MTTFTFFRSKTFLILIPILVLVMVLTGYFTVSSQSGANTNSQNSSSSSLLASVTSQSPTNSSGSNSQSSVFPSSTTNFQSSLGVAGGGGSLSPLQADSEHDVVVLEECDLAVRFNKKYGIKNSMTKNLTLAIKPIDNLSAYAVIINCDNGIDFTNNFQENSQSYFKREIAEVKFLSNYTGKIILIRNNSGTGLAAMSENYYFSYNQKNILVSFITLGQENQEKINRDVKNLISPFFDNLDLQVQPNSLAPSVPSVKLENTLTTSNSVSNSQKTLQKCDALECFSGKIGTQPVILKKVKAEGAGAGSSFFSGTITYTAAGNTPIPVKWRQINSVDCGAEGIYLCRDITIEEETPNGGILSQSIKYNKNTKQEEKGQWQWASKDGKTVLPSNFTPINN